MCALECEFRSIVHTSRRAYVCMCLWKTSKVLRNAQKSFARIYPYAVSGETMCVCMLLAFDFFLFILRVKKLSVHALRWVISKILRLTAFYSALNPFLVVKRLYVCTYVIMCMHTFYFDKLCLLITSTLMTFKTLKKTPLL